MYVSPRRRKCSSILRASVGQYELVDVARRWGFRKVEVIDEDLGRTASGAVERPGFERLVDDLCTGHVGAVLCLEACQSGPLRDRRDVGCSSCAAKSMHG